MYTPDTVLTIVTLGAGEMIQVPEEPGLILSDSMAAHNCLHVTPVSDDLTPSTQTYGQKNNTHKIKNKCLFFSF